MRKTKRSKRIRRQIDSDQNRWIISYADFMTLLFAFFVVMYAISSVNLSKLETVAISVSSAFDKRNISNGFTDNSPMISPNALPNTSSAKISDFYLSSLMQLQQRANTLSPHFFSLRDFNSWYEIEIQSSQLFKSGKATLTKKAKAELKEIAQSLKNISGPIIVEGYTDNQPINTALYPSNWSLSSARAAIVAQALDESGLSNKEISAIGYGTQYPIATNETAVGRAKNRRVVIVVAKDHSSSRLLDPMQSKLVLSQEASAPNGKSIKIMKEIKTKSGGIKFIQSNAPEDPSLKNKP